MAPAPEKGLRVLRLVDSIGCLKLLEHFSSQIQRAHTHHLSQLAIQKLLHRLRHAELLHRGLRALLSPQGLQGVFPRRWLSPLWGWGELPCEWVQARRLHKGGSDVGRAADANHSRL